jgi:hypothetical protein
MRKPCRYVTQRVANRHGSYIKTKVYKKIGGHARICNVHRDDARSYAVVCTDSRDWFNTDKLTNLEEIKFFKKETLARRKACNWVNGGKL